MYALVMLSRCCHYVFKKKFSFYSIVSLIYCLLGFTCLILISKFRQVIVKPYIKFASLMYPYFCVLRFQSDGTLLLIIIKKFGPYPHFHYRNPCEGKMRTSYALIEMVININNKGCLYSYDEMFQRSHSECIIYLGAACMELNGVFFLYASVMV